MKKLFLIIAISTIFIAPCLAQTTDPSTQIASGGDPLTVIVTTAITVIAGFIARAIEKKRLRKAGKLDDGK
jgi:hypothetical protein